jgi:hypothetical protein
MGYVTMAFGAWVAVTSPIADQVPTVGIQAAESNVWEMNIVIPGLSVESFTADGETFDQVTLPNERTAGGDGEAALPLISRIIALRTSGNPELEVVSEEWEELQGTYHLKLDQESPQGKELSAAYLGRDEYLPAESFGVTPRQVMGGVSLAVVYIRAAKYNPAQQRLQVLKSAQVRVRETGEAVSYSRPITETTAGILRAIVPNWDEVSVNVNVVKGTLLYIMANNTTVPTAIQGLVTWRIRKGYTVETAGPTQIGSMTTSGIRSFLMGRYSSADPPLEFVCLVGDAGGSFNIPTYSTGGGVGDFEYSQLDGNDLLPDVALSRYCFDTIDELNVIVNKTYCYEREPVSPSGGDSHPNWYKGGGCFAGDGSGISPVQTMRWVRELMLDVGYTSSSIDTVYYTNETVTDSKITTSINDGVSVWCYRGYYHMESYDESDIANLHNGRRLPYMTTITCATNNFDQDSGMETICELLLKAGSLGVQKGVIAAIGTSSISTHTRFNNCLVAGVIQGLLRENTPTTGGSLWRSKVELYVNYPTDSVDVLNFCHYESMLGDPAIDVFTDTPDTLYVNNPASIPVGTNTLTLTVTNQHGQNVADAYVNLVKGTEIHKGNWTGANGQVKFDFTTTTAESLFVTASMHNCRPAINFTLVTTNTRYVSPAYSTFTLDDDNIGESSGNGDGLANPGETIELALPLKNWGTSTASGVSAVLTSTDPFITAIGDNSETYGDIAAGATVLPPDDFNFTLAGYAPDGHVLQFTLTVTDNLLNTWISSIPIVVANGNLEYFGFGLYGTGNGILDPGETGELTFRLDNDGARRTPANAPAYLRSGDATVRITDSVATFTAANPGGQCNNPVDRWGLYATTYAIPGSRVPLTCIFPLDSGFADTIYWSLPVGTVTSSTPCPPDSYGYWAFDNTDLSYAKHPTYGWFEIDPRYGGSGTLLNITDDDPYYNTTEKTVVVNLPFTFKYYGQNFTQICVCSNGWIAMGADQVMHTFFRNWTIPGSKGPDYLIAPFWDDLVVTNTSSGGRIYTYNDAANHRFIIQWSRVYKYNGGSNPSETFQCILYQPGYPQTPTGDGEILFQYMTCSNVGDVYSSNDYATVGIENQTHTDGVLYSYWNIPAPGAASMTSGRAILFTTQRMPYVTPQTPQYLTTIRSGSDIRLRWSPVTEDTLGQPIILSGYKIYRDTTPFFTPGGGNYLTMATDTTYLDVGAASASTYFYVVQAYTSATLSPNGDDNGEVNAIHRPEQSWNPRRENRR